MYRSSRHSATCTWSSRSGICTSTTCIARSSSSSCGWISAAPFLEKNLEFLAECLDDLYMEQQKWNMYERNMHRQKQQQLMWLDKRRQENASRRANGEEPLPEEDPTNPIFRPVAEPGRLDTLLISNSIGNYCDQTNSFAAQVFSKLELMKAVGNQ